jgi:RNA polymerase sigma-70 factor (ECF subfamily)
MLEDNILAWKLRRGNKDVIHVLYEKYKDDLLRLAIALLNDVSASEDVVHDVFLSFVKSAHKFQLKGSLKGYLLTCVANLSRDIIRSKKRKNTVGLDKVDFVISVSKRPDQTSMYNEELRRLAFLLNHIPFEQREVIVLHAQGGMKFKEIAKSQNVSINTIKSRYRYGLDKLRSILNVEVKNEIR